MEEKISLLEKENDQFIDQEAQMRRVNNELREKLDTLKNTSPLFKTLFKTRFWNSSMKRNARRKSELGQ